MVIVELNEIEQSKSIAAVQRPSKHSDHNELHWNFEN